MASATAVILVVAAGATAATKYIITSTRQIKPSVLKQLRGATGVRGLQGLQGVQGPKGDTGTAGVSALQDVTTTNTYTMSTVTFQTITLTASCPTGQRVLSGGYWFNDPVNPTDPPYHAGAFAVTSTDPTSDDAGWSVSGTLSNGASASIDYQVKVTATCATIS